MHVACTSHWYTSKYRVQYRLYDLKWDDMNNANAKEKDTLLTVIQWSNSFPNKKKTKVDTATSQQQEHGTSELQLATCSTSLVTTVQLVTDGELPSPNIVQQQQPTIAIGITQPSCTDSDTDNITTQPGTAEFQLSAEPSSSRHCTECNTTSICHTFLVLQSNFRIVPLILQKLME